MGKEGNMQVGNVYGCYKIVKDINDTAMDIKRVISGLEKDLSDNSITLGNLRRLISNNVYTCETNCGRELWLSANDIEQHLASKDISMGCESCKLRGTRQADKSKKHPSSYTDYVGLQFESLKIMDKLDKKYEELTVEKNLHGTKLVSTLYDLYRCRCDSCGTDYVFRSDMFVIGTPDKPKFIGDINNIRARCDCHRHSIGQWVICKLLIENNMIYRAEYSPDDLYGIGDNARLHYDFAVFNDDGSIKCFIEYNGEQHEKASTQFGGERAFAVQKCIDELKRIYAKENNIKLIEIASNIKGYYAIKDVLKKSGVI